MEKYLIGKKKWIEEFDKKFVFEHSEDGEFRILYRNTLAKDIIKFISDLRKRDMEALIGMLPKMDIPKHRDYHHPDNISYTLGDVKAEKIYTRNNIEKLIKEYYEN